MELTNIITKIKDTFTKVKIADTNLITTENISDYISNTNNNNPNGTEGIAGDYEEIEPLFATIYKNELDKAVLLTVVFSSVSTDSSVRAGIIINSEISIPCVCPSMGPGLYSTAVLTVVLPPNSRYQFTRSNSVDIDSCWIIK